MSEAPVDAADLFDELPSGQMLLNPDGTILRMNLTLARWLDEPAADLAGRRTFQSFLGPGDRIFYDTHFAPLLQMQRFVSEINFSLRRRDGSVLPMLISANEVYDETGRPRLIRMSLVVISDRKKYEAELRAERLRAEQALRAKADFVSLLTHEVRTPLNAIIGVSHLLAETNLDPEQRQFSDMLASSSDNLLRLLNSILDYSKMDSGKATVEDVAFEFERSVRTTALGFRGTALRKNVDLRIEVAPDIPSYVVGDQVKITQMINNLVGNAIKFTARGSVTLAVDLAHQRADSVEVRFRIIDTGIGIAENIIPKIFEEYAQADERTGATYGGTGLGLAIVHRLAALMGTRVHVTSELGRGSTFSFTLRLGRAENAPVVQPASAPDATSLRGLRLLVADDSEDNQTILGLQLARWGIEVTRALNGREVLDKLDGCSYDLILMDLRMPVMDGYATTAAIRQRPHSRCATIPIIAFSASATLAERDITSNLQFQDVLGKPYKPGDLFEKIRKHTRASTAIAPSLTEAQGDSESSAT